MSDPTTPRATNRVVDKDGNIWYQVGPDVLRRVTEGNQTIEYRVSGTGPDTTYQTRTYSGTAEAQGESGWADADKSAGDAFQSQFNAAVYQVPVGAVNGARAGTVDFSDNSVRIPINNDRFGKYLPHKDSEGNLTGKVIYAEYDNDGKVIEGTAKVYDDNHPEYVNLLAEAQTNNPGAAKRGAIKGGKDGSSVDIGDDDSIASEFDPFRPYKGNVLIVTQNSKVASVTPEEAKATSTDEQVSVYLNPTEARLNEVRSDINDTNKNKIKEFDGLSEKDNLTNEAFIEYAQEYSTGTFTNVREDGTVSTFQWVNSLQGDTKNRAVSKEMKFNIVTGRGSYLSNSDSYIGQDFIVTDRAPLDYIKYLAQQEPWPTVVWQDPRTGEFWYVPRGLDISGLSDPLRFNRTYFFRQYPEDISKISHGDVESKPVTFPRNNPHMATMLHSFREEESSVSVRTNIMVQSQAPKAMTGNKGNYLHLAVIPPQYRVGDGRAYAASFFTVTDNTATQNPGSLIAIALSFARQVGKELKAGACTMLGDPSLIPGEAVQIIGSPAQQGYVSDVSNINADRQRFLEMSGAYESFYVKLPDVIKDYSGEAIVEFPEDTLNYANNGKSVDQPVKMLISGKEVSADGMFMETAMNVQQDGNNTIGFKPEPATMWRVEAVIDKFNDGVDGYYTEVSLMSCF